jgi:hypothetical protein
MKTFIKNNFYYILVGVICLILGLLIMYFPMKGNYKKYSKTNSIDLTNTTSNSVTIKTTNTLYIYYFTNYSTTNIINNKFTNKTFITNVNNYSNVFDVYISNQTYITNITDILSKTNITDRSILQKSFIFTGEADYNFDGTISVGGDIQYHISTILDQPIYLGAGYLQNIIVPNSTIKGANTIKIMASLLY